MAFDSTEYDSLITPWDYLRNKVTRVAVDSIGYVNKKRKNWFDENKTQVTSLP